MGKEDEQKHIKMRRKTQNKGEKDARHTPWECVHFPEEKEEPVKISTIEVVGVGEELHCPRRPGKEHFKGRLNEGNVGLTNRIKWHKELWLVNREKNPLNLAARKSLIIQSFSIMVD